MEFHSDNGKFFCVPSKHGQNFNCPGHDISFFDFNWIEF